MAKDQRLYAKFTLDFPTNPKIKPLSDAAFRCLFEAILWSRQHTTDGFLPRRFAVASWCFEVLQELCSNDDENPSLKESPEGWWIHDFIEHQTTKAEIEERRESKIRAGQKGGIASGRSRREAKTKQTPKQMRSKTKPETETETEIDITTDVVISALSRFDDFWDTYPRRRDKRKAEKAFANALKRADINVIIAGAERYANDPNRAEQFTKYAEGWLNGDGWLDEPLPSRNGHHRVPASDAAFAAAQALKAQPTRLELQ